MNKKAGLTDLFVFIIMAFIIVVIAGIFIYLSTQTETKLHETLDPMNTDDVNNTAIIDDTFGNIPTALETLYWLTFLIITAMILSIFIGSYLVTTKPVFIVPYIFLMIIAIICSVGISNAYEQIASDPTLTSTFAQFTGSNFILAYLPLWVTIVGFIGAIIMFSRMGSKEESAYYG